MSGVHSVSFYLVVRGRMNALRRLLYATFIRFLSLRRVEVQKKPPKSSSTHKHIKSLREVSNFLALFDLFWESFQGVEICFRRLGNVQMWWFRGTWKVFHSLMLFMSPLASVSGGIILKYENFMNEKLLHHGVYLRKWPLTPYYFTMWRNYWPYDSHKIATIHLKTRLHI